MPGNIIRINDSDSLEFYVGDSKMSGLLRWLKRHAFSEKRHPTKPKPRGGK